jgi:hypothetical protein
VDNWSLKHLLYFEHSGCAVVPEKSRVFKDLNIHHLYRAIILKINRVCFGAYAIA